MKREAAEHLQRAAELLHVSQNDLDAGFPADSVSHSYYAFVVKKGLLDTRYHNYFHKAFEARHDCDYLSIPKETHEGATVMLQRATEFVAACQAFLEK